jgi:hypothetical protein
MKERGVRYVDGEFKLTLDGQHFISVPPRIMEMIRKAEKVQGRIDQEQARNPLFELEMSDLASSVLAINCHKAALYARGDISDQVLTSTGDDSTNRGYADVIQLAKDFRHEHGVLFSLSDVREFAETHADQFPFSVHIFRAVKTNEKNGLFPTHSFLWLGNDDAGNEICYQKRGPDILHPFEPVSLNEATEGYENIPAFYVIVPIVE